MPKFIHLLFVIVSLAFVTAVEYVTPIKDANAQLTKQNDRLENQIDELKKANGKKWTFINNVSFDSIVIGHDEHANIDDTFCDHRDRTQCTDEEHEYCITIK